jgi:ribonuclease HIII
MTIEEKAKNQIEILQHKCEKEKLATSRLSKKDYNYEFTVDRGKEKIKVQVYFGKKGIKTILQGDLKCSLYKELNNLMLDEPKLALNDPTFIEPEEYIGSDECGKGDFFGPLVVSAVFVNKETRKQLSNIGVRDSKELSDYTITSLAGEIKKIIGSNFEIVRINPHKYNDLYKRFNNLNKLLDWAHSKAIDNLLDNTMCKYVITDKFSKKELDVVSLAKHSDVEFIQETKAEKYIGVAAASILARDSFVDWFESHSRKGLDLPKGSSIETEKFAKKLLQKIGEEKLGELGKLHFKTFEKIK